MDLSHRRRRVKSGSGVPASPGDPAWQAQKPLAELALTSRAINALEEAGLIFVADVLSRSREWLLGLDNFGERALNELAGALRAVEVVPPRDWEPETPGPKRSSKSRRPG